MKVGAENRNKLIIAGSLFAVAAVMIGYTLLSAPSGSAPPPNSAATETAFGPVSHAPAPGKKTKGAPAHSIDPSLRYDLLKASEDTKYEGNGRNIFTEQAEIPTPVASALVKKGPVVPPPPPPPPPINLKFFGYANNPGEGKRIFLSQGEDVFIAHEGDIVDRRYKIVHIMPTSVEVQDVLNNNTQSIPLTLG